MGRIRALRRHPSTGCIQTRYRRACAELRRLRAQLAEHAARLRRSVDDIRSRDLLLAELNHRTRNDLALIVSFLELQQAGAATEEVAVSLRLAIQRVSSVAVAHRLLTDFGTTDCETLFRQIAQHTVGADPLRDRVSVRVSAALPPLPPRSLTALAVVLNELFMNVAKHAFPDGRTGSVSVDASASNNEATVRVRDSGVGMQGERTGATGQMGLEIVRLLVQVSLKGRCTFSADRHGTTVCIHFPVPNGQTCPNMDRTLRRAA